MPQRATLLKQAAFLAAVCAMVLSACGGESLTLSEYSSEVAALVLTFDDCLDAEAEEYRSVLPSVEGTLDYLKTRVESYRELIVGIDALDPPEQVADLHATLQRIMNRLLVAEERRLAFAETLTTVNELDLVWEGPEAVAIRAVEEEAVVLCHAAQATFDATEQREDFADVPWMPAELKEVVRVALNCP